MSKPEIVIGGYRLSAIMSWGELEWTTCWPGGTESITFSVARSHRLFRPDAIVEVDYGGTRLAVGALVEPTRGEPLLAEGLHRKGEDYAALDSGDEATVDAETATIEAIDRGLPWTTPGSFAASGPDLDPDQPRSLAQILDHKALTLDGQEWGIDPTTRMPYFAPWDTTPLYHVLPGVDGLAISRDGYASTLKARYLNTATGLYETVTGHDAVAAKRWGRVERTLPDLLGDGVTMTTIEAQALVDGLITRGATQIGWASPLEVQHGDLVNEHAQAVDLNKVYARRMIRVHGLIEDVADISGQTWRDMNAARTTHKDRVVTIAPRGLSSPMNDALAGVRPQ